MASEERGPFCPACGKRMKLARVFDRGYGRYRLRTYECDGCKLSYTEGDADEDRDKS